MVYEIARQHNEAKGNMKVNLRIKLKLESALKKYPDELRLIKADVEVDGKLVTMTFITNNFEWATSSIAELYKARWAIEVFFKEIKQNLQFADLLGHNENAVR